MKRKRYRHIKCKDGFTMSVQAGDRSYCRPRNNCGPYRRVEVGFPTLKENLLMPYIDGDPEYENPLEAVYGYVPVEVIMSVIDKHGGQIDGELPPIAIT